MYGRQCGLFAQWPHVALITVCFHVVRRRVAFSFPKGHEKMSERTVGAPRWYFCLKKAVHLSSTDNETGAVDLFISKRAMMCGRDDMGECFAPVVQSQLKDALRSTEGCGGHLPEYWHVTEMSNCSPYGVPWVLRRCFRQRPRDHFSARRGTLVEGKQTGAKVTIPRWCACVKSQIRRDRAVLCVPSGFTLDSPQLVSSPSSFRSRCRFEAISWHSDLWRCRSTGSWSLQGFC